MTHRVVLYAEGAGERRGTLSMLPAPGEALPEEALGAGHILVRRALERACGVPPAATRFEAPLRLRGRMASGSDLHDGISLRKLLTWFNRSQQPHLAVVLVDADGDSQRKRRLEAYVATLPCAKVIAVAVQEFEAWLLADVKAIQATLGSHRPFVGPAEKLAPRVAKDELNAWIAASPSAAEQGGDPSDLRRAIAGRCDLDVLTRECPAFADFVSDLRSC